MASGYRDPLYAQAFTSWGTTVELPACGGTLLARPLTGTDAVDVQGCYPVWACATPSAAPEALRALQSHVAGPVVTVAVVLDPLRDWPLKALRTLLTIHRELQPHVVVDLRGWSERITTHHRRAIRRTERRGLDIRVEDDPCAFVPDWCRLYATLVRRADIRGLRAFSPAIFATMARVPGTRIISARLDGEVVGADWYLEDGPLVYAHLSAYADRGYTVGASYALLATALDDFSARGCAQLDLGGVPSDGATGGLRSFKSGWSPLTRSAHFLGAVLDRERYAALGGAPDPASGGFFPAYRRDEY